MKVLFICLPLPLRLSIIIAISLIYIHGCPPKLMSRRSLAIFIDSSDFRRDAVLVENNLLCLAWSEKCKMFTQALKLSQICFDVNIFPSGSLGL